MREIFIGATIRRKRMELSQTQEKLCEGLCDPSTLSRIENGKQTPSRHIANALLQRLGLPHDRYYTFLTASEAEAEALRTETDRCTVRFHQSLGEEKCQARTDALEQLDRLETVTKGHDRINRQYILSARAVLGKKTGPYRLETKRSMLLEAIRLTVPQFDLETLGGGLYSLDEMEIISQIAGTYSEAGQHEKAAGIFNQLLTYIREHYQNVTCPSRYLTPVTLHYARELCLMGRYKDALKTAELGRRTCLAYGYCQSLPGLLAVMAECRYAIGEYKQSRVLYCQAYYLFKETGNTNGLACVEKAARKRLGDGFLFQEALV